MDRSIVQRLVATSGLLMMLAALGWLILNPSPNTPRSIEQQLSPRPPFALVVLDPGHGGQDSGAMCGALAEKDLTLDVAQRVERLLQTRGIGTLMTRVGDAYTSLADRAAITNRATDCIFVSIHFNDGHRQGASGVETYFAAHQQPQRLALASWLPFLQHASNDDANLESQSLAGFIQDSLVKRTSAINRGTKAEQFFVIANVRHPAVLVEGGFITNKEDMAKLGNSEYRQQVAVAIADGIEKYRELITHRSADPPRS